MTYLEIYLVRFSNFSSIFVIIIFHTISQFFMLQKIEIMWWLWCSQSKGMNVACGHKGESPSEVPRGHPAINGERKLEDQPAPPMDASAIIG